MFEWDDDQYRLGVDEMDDLHQEFVELVNAAQVAASADFPSCFDALKEHARRHFEREDALMETSGFSATAEHRDEHARILGDLERMSRRVRQGRLAMARAYVGGLPAWFKQHAVSMDSALAAHLRSST